MEREAGHARGRDDHGTPDADLGLDDEEFASVEDVGKAPSENASVDDV